MMSDLESKYAAIKKAYGEWTAHNIYLGNGLYTMGAGISHDEYKVRRIVQIAEDQLGSDWQDKRVLDLACLEGMYGIEFAMRGAEVLAIEGREQHIAKAQFAAESLGLDSFNVIQGDVRKLNVEEHGQFDVILCLGILYHIDGESLFPFIEAMYECCRGILIIDTHVAIKSRKTLVFKDFTYEGIDYYEYATDLSAERKKGAVWASLDNPDSFWPTSRSLFNALADVGFSSAFECQNPPELAKTKDRITILAVKGSKIQLRCNPQLNDKLLDRWPERANQEIHPYQYRYRVWVRRMIDAVPQGLKDAIKKIFGRE